LFEDREILLFLRDKFTVMNTEFNCGGFYWRWRSLHKEA